MRMKREGEEEEVWWNWEKRGCKLQTDNFTIKLFALKNLKIKLFAGNFKRIYCKYLHGE